METNPGLTTKDAQYSICKGTYGGKEWSSAERQAACQRYEEITGTKLESSSKPSDLSAAAVTFALFITIVFAYVLYRRKTTLKTITAPRPRKANQK